MGSKLDRRMVGYTAAVAAAGVGATANATIIDAKQSFTINHGNSQSIDFDGVDGLDVQLSNFVGDSNGQRYYIQAGSNTNKGASLGNTTALYATAAYPADTAFPVRPAALTAGTTIGLGLSYGNDTGGASNVLAGDGTAGDATFGLDSGLFPTDGSTRYVGVEFASGGTTYFGWVGVQLTPASATGTITITDYAYDNSGAPIAAGDTGSSTPEPASLAALALGAVTMLARPRGKKF